MGTYTVLIQTKAGGDWALLYTIQARASETPEYAFKAIMQAFPNSKWVAVKCLDAKGILMWQISS